MDIPNIASTTKGPTNEIGTAMTGMTVERQSPRNKKTTRVTRMNASRMVSMTCSIEAFKNLDTS